VLETSGFAPTPLTAQELWLEDALYHAQKRSSSKETYKQSEKYILSRSMNLLPTRCACSTVVSMSPLTRNIIGRKCEAVPGRYSYYYNETSRSVTAQKISSNTSADLDEYANSLAPNFFPGRIGYNPVEMNRFYKRVFGSQATTQWPPHWDVSGREQIHAFVREVFEHATRQATRSLMNEKIAEHELVLSDDEDEDTKDNSRQANPGAASSNENREGEYRWSPLDVLCSRCFQSVFSEKFYAWWLEERQSSRVERELIS
jgi:hypothetical protein